MKLKCVKQKLDQDKIVIYNEHKTYTLETNTLCKDVTSIRNGKLFRWHYGPYFRLSIHSLKLNKKSNKKTTRFLGECKDPIKIVKILREELKDRALLEANEFIIKLEEYLFNNL